MLIDDLSRKDRKIEELEKKNQRIDELEKKLESFEKEKTEDEKIIKYANSITYLTSKKTEIVDKVLGVKHLLKKSEK